MASNESDGFESASKLEGARRQSTISGNGQAADTTLDGQPGSTLLMPATHTLQQRPANPAPLGLLSIATIFFLLACYGVQARGVTAPNIFIGTVVFFGGLGQTIAGLMDFVAGNTFGATVFTSYGAFNFSYAMIYLPGSGILAAYTDADTGALDASFTQALAVWLWCWFVLTVLYTAAAVRTSWVLLLDLASLALYLLLLACGHMLANPTLITAAAVVAFVIAFLSYWAGMAGLCAGGTTPWRIPMFDLH